MEVSIHELLAVAREAVKSDYIKGESILCEEYKNVRKHLLANLEGDLAWRYDKSTYECLKKKQRTEDVRSR